MILFDRRLMSPPAGLVICKGPVPDTWIVKSSFEIAPPSGLLSLIEILKLSSLAIAGNTSKGLLPVTEFKTSKEGKYLKAFFDGGNDLNRETLANWLQQLQFVLE